MDKNGFGANAAGTLMMTIGGRRAFIIDLAFERPVRPISDFTEALGVTYGGALNNIRELVAHGVAEEVAATYPKLIRFPGVLAALGVG